MPVRNQAALDFLLTRRSVPAKTMTGPVPDKSELEVILTAAARSPDHGKLVPWRFVVLQGKAFERIIEEIKRAGVRQNRSDDEIAKPLPHYNNAQLAVVVVEKVDTEASIPVVEQVYSAGAVCMALTNAALASGWGANWLSGWFSHDATFRKDAFGLDENERVVGIVHIGTPKSEPSDRPRPDVAAITSWVNE
ncbi:MAG: nitroreductase [Paracoccaceae bacterium]|nr:nitroreductase [Paracoccaceae bacterium]MDG2259633.1 nitroreductase [Paracoccaceae bacterium]